MPPQRGGAVGLVWLGNGGQSEEGRNDFRRGMCVIRDRERTEKGR